MKINSIDIGVTGSLLIRLREFWLGLEKKGIAPAYKDFDILDFPEHVPHLAIVKVDAAAKTFRYTFIGNFVISMAERDATGRCLDETLYPEHTGEILWPYEHAAETGRPVVTVGPVQFVDKPWSTIQNLFLPFTDDGKTVSCVICCVTPIEDIPGLQIEKGLHVADWTK